ncbi:MAG: hypothetical protein QY317_16285 [Candidatus Jettenia caeni]|nr:MAG: hypothetical protein QY317_16285 [Candidatus Jettenia caeni]
MQERYCNTKFGSWVKDYGVYSLSRELDVTPSAVYHWIRGTAKPRPGNIIRLVELSKGGLTLDHIYQHLQVQERRVGNAGRF